VGAARHRAVTPDALQGRTGFAVVAAGLAASPFREARHDDAAEEPSIGG
jgi:hypothetical protein